MKRMIFLMAILMALNFAAPRAQSQDNTVPSQTVQTGNPPSEELLKDGKISVSIKSQFLNDSLVKDRGLAVVAAYGEVDLFGNVATEVEAARAVELAAGVDGVELVRSHLQLDPTLEPAPGQ